MFDKEQLKIQERVLTLSKPPRSRASGMDVKTYRDEYKREIIKELRVVIGGPMRAM